jgi:hypothetical protein
LQEPCFFYPSLSEPLLSASFIRRSWFNVTDTFPSITCILSQAGWRREACGKDI